MKKIPTMLAVLAALAVSVVFAVEGHNLLISWGDPWNSENEVPLGVTNIVQIAAGGYHSLALLSDGSVIAWGDNSLGQCDVPADVTNAVAVSAGGSDMTGIPCPDDGGHSMALLADGTVRCWGWDGENECGTWHQSFNPPSYGMPADMATGGVVAISAGGFHSVALMSDGTVRVWGYDGCGEISGMPDGLSNIVSIAAGESFTMALKNDGSVTCWGIDDEGQCSTPPDLATGTVVTAVAAGARHAMALLEDGTVRCWGRDYDGECDVPGEVTGAIAIAAGDRHSAAVLSTGRVVCWGANDLGQCEPPYYATNVLAIAAGGVHNVAVIYYEPDVPRGGMAGDLWNYTTNYFTGYPYPTNQNASVTPPDLPAGAGDTYNSFTSGMCDAWLLVHFGTLAVDPDADPDGDGLTNLQEYLLGTNPNVADPSDPLGVVKLQLFTPLEP